MHRGFGGVDCARRRQVLRETVAAFEQSGPPGRYHRLAKQNLDRWRSESHVLELRLRVQVFPGDWGEVARSLTRTHGTCFAVLNMANAYVPGGAYMEGAVAQEENLFRRTDCHFRIGGDEYDSVLDRYQPEMTRLLSAQNGRVYLDVQHPRVCIRGAEDRSRADLGYSWLPEDEVFPFFELRATAQDLRDGSDFDPDDTRRRVLAQLHTLREHGIRHVVLGAFGCGAFRNPADRVARVYREEITKRTRDFSVIAFAVFSAGYGPNNYTPFAEAFRGE
ncbi:MAG: poly(ADP-ribose) glycohydrolase domain-containing protein [Candidatus Acidiferrum sp.]